MTEPNAARVRAVYERWAVGDFTAGTELYDPAVELVIGPDFPESGSYRGLEEIKRYMRRFLESWDRLTISAADVIEADGNVVVEVVQTGTGAGSGAETDLRYFHVWTFGGDRVVRWQNFRGRDEALAAAGRGA